MKRVYKSLLMLILVFLVSCSGTTNYQSSGQREKPPVAVSPETSQEDASSLLIMDKTVSVPLLRLTGKENVMEVNATADFDVSYRDISELCEAAAVKNIVYGTVQEVGFYEGYPSGQTLYNFIVEKSFAGELQEGDKISVLASGGYLSLGRYIETYGGERFEDMTEEEIENTVLKQTCMGAPFAKTGETYMLFLSKEKTQEDAPTPVGSFVEVGAFMGRFYYNEEKLLTRYTPENEPGFYQNPVTKTTARQVFTLEELENEISACLEASGSR